MWNNTVPYGIDPSYYHQSQQNQVIAVATSYISICIIAVSLRFYSRHVAALGYWWDDWFALITMVRTSIHLGSFKAITITSHQATNHIDLSNRSNNHTIRLGLASPHHHKHQSSIPRSLRPAIVHRYSSSDAESRYVQVICVGVVYPHLRHLSLVVQKQCLPWCLYLPVNHCHWILTHFSLQPCTCAMDTLISYRSFFLCDEYHYY